jgi:diguanylate cyclase (GGDEF)-like protein
MKKIIRFFKTGWLVWKYGEKLYLDGLTGVYSRVLLKEFGEREIERAKRYGHSLALVMVDLDNLKQINDCYGHRVGDEALKKVGDILKGNSRKVDLVFRYGGDEFIVLIPETTENGVEKYLERITREFKNSRVKVSFGIAFWEEEVSLERLIARADKKLYKNKHQKRPKQ